MFLARACSYSDSAGAEGSVADMDAMVKSSINLYLLFYLFYEPTYKNIVDRVSYVMYGTTIFTGENGDVGVDKK